MSRPARVLIYLCTAFVTCVLWIDGPARSTLWWGAPQPLPPTVEEDPKESDISPEQQQTLAWETEQRRRKVVLNLACRQWLPKASKYLPKGKDDLKYLLVDDQHKALYCFVPKVGCTNWKRLWMILTGLSQEDNPQDIPEDVPHLLHDQMMLVNQPYDASELQHKLDTYKKLIVVRDPFERFLSAYRDKLEGGTNKVYQEKVANKIKSFWPFSSHTPKNVTFPEFVDFVTGLSDTSYFDEHWRPYHKLCFPCAIRYHVIAKYETLTEDSERFLRLIGAPDNLHFPPYVPGNTSCILPQYMASLSQAQRRKLYKLYQRDFEAFEYQPFGGPD
ncbi:carbohydrate sulfotransferase 11-like [Eriocheir sinensis]|uniref:carbohydrate sulfotransferase 11-like n=1 Tax=Eriocheir sinensis TaxID=95602 RepID=UPI0021C63C60|nr:carbohydrate sulfotransferase 11-like [Eriocheir sinensis]